MKASDFKKIIKEAVREAIKDELRDILLEAVKGSKQQVVVKETIKENKATTQANPMVAKQIYNDILGNIANEMTMTTNTLQIPRGPMNTIAEGTSLPQGEVSLDMIAGLMNAGQ